jgi:Flp pilus assembly pilin Flp
MKLHRLLRQLVFDDSGQDIIEYGLLAVAIALVGYLVMPSIKAGMDAAYASWTAEAYEQWCPDDPGGGATCSTEP